jgi:hypothetical protein
MTATMEREVTTATATPTAEHRRAQNGVKPEPVRPHRGRARRGGRWSGLALLLMLVALLAIVATADPVGVPDTGGATTRVVEPVAPAVKPTEPEKPTGTGDLCSGSATETTAAGQVERASARLPWPLLFCPDVAP